MNTPYNTIENMSENRSRCGMDIPRSMGILPMSGMGVPPMSGMDIPRSMGILPMSGMGILPMSGMGILPMDSPGRAGTALRLAGKMPVPRLAWAVLGALAVLAAAATEAHAAPIIQKYVNFSVTPSTLDLGTVPQPGVYDSLSELKVHVTANCLHGGVVASVTALERPGGGSIGPERVFVKLPASGKYVPMTGPMNVTGLMNPGVFDVILKFRVQTTMADAPGDYAGTITITCATAP